MLNIILLTLLSLLKSRQALAAENLALRHQIEVLQRKCSWPAFRWRDRAFWDVLSCLWPDWRRSLYIVKPETVIRWHRRGLSMGDSPEIPHPRSRRYLRLCLLAQGLITGHQADPYGKTIDMAKSIRRTGDRIDSEGMPGSRDHLR